MECDDLFEIPIPTLSNYRITKQGKIWSFHSRKFLKTKVCNGYKCFTRTLHKTNDMTLTKTFAIHRLLAEVFIPNPNKYKIVHHKNENKLDNRLDNLEWVTQKNNIQQCSKNTSHPRKVIQICEDGFQIIYYSITEAAREIGLSRSAISKASLGINKTAGGYKWIYEDTTNNHDSIDLSEAKQIKEFPTYYVLRNGKVYNTKRKSLLKPVRNASGYCYVTLCHNGKKKNHYVHRLVASYFLDRRQHCVEVNHKNKIRHDNIAQNLEWVTRPENMKHMYTTQGSDTKLLEKSNSGSS